MSIQTGDNSLGAAIEAQRNQQTQQTQQQTHQQTEQKRSFGGRSALRFRPVGRNENGELLRNLHKTFGKSLDNELQRAEDRQLFDLIPMDRGQYRIAYSHLLVVMKASDGAQSKAAVFALKLEGSAMQQLRHRQLTIGQQQLLLEQVPADTDTAALRQQINEVVSTHLGLPTSDIFEAGMLTVPTEFDVNSEDAVHSLMYRSTQALFTIMNAAFLKLEDPISAATIAQEYDLAGTLDYSGAEVFDAVGLPVRSDVSITLVGNLKGMKGQNTEYQGIDGELPLTRVDGFLDLTWADPTKIQLPYGMGAAPTQRYLPRFVITRLDSQQDQITLEQQLMGLYTAGLLSQNFAWIGALRGSRIVGGRNLRDIGAIGLELDPKNPVRIPTSDGTFGDAQLSSLARMAIFDNMGICLDVDEAGEQSWINRVFLDAAQSLIDPQKAQRANALIAKAANTLFGGHLSQFWDGSQPVMTTEMYRVQTGYYVDDKGEKRDIRDIDYLAMLNLHGERDLNTLYTFNRTLAPAQVPQEVQTVERGVLLRNQEPNYKLKGYAWRLTVNTEFLKAMSRAAVACGFVVRPDRLFSAYGANQERVGYNPQHFGLSSADMAGAYAFTQQGVGAGHNNGYYGGSGYGGYGGLYR